MVKYSISFVLLVLFLGLMIGTVGGSLLEQIFGLGVLNFALFGDGPLTLIEDFYLITKLQIQLTTGGLLGFAIAAWLLYRKGRS
tara:strand:- start:214 stop:465 length:252 start_codon:yes stop_codon:yes gene_type:complete